MGNLFLILFNSPWATKVTAIKFDLTGQPLEDSPTRQRESVTKAAKFPAVFLKPLPNSADKKADVCP